MRPDLNSPVAKWHFLPNLILEGICNFFVLTCYLGLPDDILKCCQAGLVGQFFLRT